MRIKKKYAVQESMIMEGLMVDDLNTFSSQEKKILKTLNKMYYKPNDPEFRWWQLSSYEIQEMLHEKWELPFGLAYKLAHVFVLYGESLFRENKMGGDIHSSEILSTYLDNFVNNYRKSLPNDTLSGGDWPINTGGSVQNHEPLFWDSYNGFLLYLPVNREDRWEKTDSERERMEATVVMVRCTFDFKTDPTNPTISITYKQGEEQEYNGVILDKAIIDLPNEVTKQSMSVFLDDMVTNHVRTLVEDWKFPEPILPTKED